MRTLYIVVHPEATHHVDRLVGGWYDSNLTPVGIQAAKSVARSLRSQVPKEANIEIITSVLQRTRQTAKEIANVFDIEPILDSRLREKSYGQAEGKSQAWMKQHLVPPPAIGDRERLEHYDGIEGAESKMQWSRRIYEAIDDILQRPCEHQIIVTHGGSLTYVLAAWIKMPVEAAGYVNFYAPTGSITILREDDHWHNRQVVRLGEVSHLDITLDPSIRLLGECIG